MLPELQAQQSKVLDLSYMGLSMVHASWLHEELEHLILDGNNLDEDLELPVLRNLRTLSLNKNNIDDLPRFLRHIGKQCPRISHLSLLGNPTCPTVMALMEGESYIKYRATVISFLPYLTFLDSTPVSHSDRKRNNPPTYPPTRNQGIYRKVKYSYSGKNSEGNRFIHDNEL